MESQMLAITETNIIHILSSSDLFTLHKANLICYTYPKGKNTLFTCCHCCSPFSTHKKDAPLRAAQTGKWDILDKETNQAKLSNIA